MAGSLAPAAGWIGAAEWDTSEIEGAARAELRGRADAQTHLAEGARLSLSHALTLARAIDEEPVPRPDRRLSRRELEIAQLIGRGRSNRDIADELHLSVRTVKGHVEHGLSKLAFRSRVQVPTWAAEHSVLD